VIDSQTGLPVADAEVLSANGDTNLISRTTADGQYSLTGLPPNNYLLYAKKDGYVYSHFRVVNVSANGMSIQQIDLAVQKRSYISGRVIGRDDLPIADAEVTAWSRVFRDGRPQFLVRSSGTTDRRGEYRLDQLADGDYYLGVRPSLVNFRAGHSTLKDPKHAHVQLAYASTLYPNAKTFSEAIPVHVRLAEQREDVELMVDKAPAFCASASIATASSTMEALTTVMVSEVSEGWDHPLGGGAVGPTGEFEICGLTVGTAYVLTANSWKSDIDVGGFFRREFVGTNRDAELGVLDLGLISMHRGEKVVGTVVVEGARPGQLIPDGINVILDPLARLSYFNETTHSRVEPSGDFGLPSVFPDEHWLGVSGLPTGFYLKTATYNRTDLLRDPWKSADGELRILLGADGASLTGRVFDKEGRAVSDGAVLLAPRAVSHGDRYVTPIFSRHVDQNGYFRFLSAVAPGEYYVFAVQGLPETELQNPDIARRYLFWATEVSLVPRDNHNISLTLLDNR
jgi:hypothetical protein